MPHISKRKLSLKAEKALITNLNSVLTRIGDSQEMVGFIHALLTPTEELMIAKRLALIILIEEGMNDSQIADTLHVTRITVAKMRYFYESRGKGFQIALKKLHEQKQFKNFKSLLVSLASYSARAAGGYVKSSILD